MSVLRIERSLDFMLWRWLLGPRMVQHGERGDRQACSHGNAGLLRLDVGLAVKSAAIRLPDADQWVPKSRSDACFLAALISDRGQSGKARLFRALQDAHARLAARERPDTGASLAHHQCPDRLNDLLLG